jgi:chromate transporter
LTWGVGRLWERLAGWPWLDAVQRGLAPVSIGLALSGAITVARGALLGPTTMVIAVAVLAILLSRHINPVYLILASGAAGALLLAT